MQTVMLYLYGHAETGKICTVELAIDNSTATRFARQRAVHTVVLLLAVRNVSNGSRSHRC